jgi:hypothetical protein
MLSRLVEKTPEPRKPSRSQSRRRPEPKGIQLVGRVTPPAFAANDAVDCFSDGSWYAAQLKKVRDAKVAVHFIGFDFDFDETIAKTSVRLSVRGTMRPIVEFDKTDDVKEHESRKARERDADKWKTVSAAGVEEAGRSMRRASRAQSSSRDSRSRGSRRSRRTDDGGGGGGDSVTGGDGATLLTLGGPPGDAGDGDGAGGDESKALKRLKQNSRRKSQVTLSQTFLHNKVRRSSLLAQVR